MYFVHKIVTRVSTVSHDQHHMILISVASCDNEFSSRGCRPHTQYCGQLHS